MSDLSVPQVTTKAGERFSVGDWIPDTPLLQVKALVKHYLPFSGGSEGRRSPTIRAVDRVSFEIWLGEILRIVGESGCSKSTVAKAVLRLVEPTAGRAIFKGGDPFTLSRRELREVRRDIQIIFQDPYASVNPRMRVGDIISEPWAVFPDTQPRQEWNTS